MKRQNPYTTLKEEFRKYVIAAKHPHRKAMWTYPKAKLSEGWALTDLSERVAAADQLGYDVVLTSTENGLEVYYRKKIQDGPWWV